jgi:peptidoglycan/xylan/chitin deacetylase (PgdA/CDA1 family)
MSGLMKKMGMRILTHPPISTALRARAMRGNSTIILCYHTLRPTSETLDAWTVLGLDDFHDQLDYLRKYYEIVSISEALERRGEPGRPRVVLTFDDGEWGLFQHLLPIVQDKKIPVTVYVATRQIETGEPFWFDRVMNATQATARAEIDIQLAGRTRWQIGPLRGKERWNQISSLLEAFKTVPEEERDRMADLVLVQAKPVENGFSPLQPMSLAQFKCLAAHPLVTIGAHSHGHELLDQIPLECALRSIQRSKELLEEWSEEPVSHFAYPNGNYSVEIMSKVESLGFATATILGGQLVQEDADPFALPRIGVGRYDSHDRFRVRLMGIG